MNIFLHPLSFLFQGNSCKLDMPIALGDMPTPFSKKKEKNICFRFTENKLYFNPLSAKIKK